MAVGSAFAGHGGVNAAHLRARQNPCRTPTEGNRQWATSTGPSPPRNCRNTTALPAAPRTAIRGRAASRTTTPTPAEARAAAVAIPMAAHPPPTAPPTRPTANAAATDAVENAQAGEVYADGGA